MLLNKCFKSGRFYLCGILLLTSGCSYLSTKAHIVSQADGQQVYHIQCGGALSSINACINRAKNICGNKTINSSVLQDLNVDNGLGLPYELYVSCYSNAANNLEKVESKKKLFSETLEQDSNFDFDKYSLNAFGRNRLSLLVEKLKRYSIDKISIYGHTDSTGSSQYNYILSQRRAQAIKDFLVENGVESGSWDIQWFGESQPIVENTSKENRAKNRRVEIIVIGSGLKNGAIEGVNEGASGNSQSK